MWKLWICIKGYDRTFNFVFDGLMRDFNNRLIHICLFCGLNDKPMYASHASSLSKLHKNIFFISETSMYASICIKFLFFQVFSLWNVRIKAKGLSKSSMRTRTSLTSRGSPPVVTILLVLLTPRNHISLRQSFPKFFKDIISRI